MSTVPEVYAFLAKHPFVCNTKEADFLVQLFTDLANGKFDERGQGPPPPSVLSFI